MALSVGELIAYLRLESAQFDTGIAAARAELASASVSAQRFGASVSESEAALSGAGRQANVASSGTAKFRAAQLSALAATERYNTLLNDESATLGRVASAEASVIRANERLKASSPAAAIMTTNREIASSPGLLARTSSGLIQATKSMVGLGVAFGAFEAVKHITQASNEFQRAMIQVQTNADVTHTEVVKASAALLAMAGPVAAAPEKLAVAFYHAKSVGLDYAHAIETTRIAAEGARVGNADLEETMNALTSTVASGIPGVRDMSSAMGTLIAIVGSGDMKLSDLNEALGTGVLVRMKQYGLSLTDVGAALSTFGDNNIRGADAATLLRMSVEAMAKQGAPGAKALKGIGIEADQLRKDMQSGGLNKALLDLNDHLKAAGITGNKVGGYLIDAFTKKGGGGVAVLLGQLDRLESKFAILRSSGATFGEKWKATTQTASFALASLGHSLEAAGIQADAKFGPAIANIARLLVGSLRVGLEIAKDALTPFVAAWKVLSPVLSAVGSALGGVAHFLSPVAPVLKGVAGGALAVWAAFKLFTIARAAVIGLIEAVDLLGGRAVFAFTRMELAAGAAQSRITGMSARTATAAVGLTAGIGLLTAAWQINSQRAAEAAQRVQDYTNALTQSNGAVDANVRAMVIQKLASDGAYDAAKKYGVAQNDVTDAALGSLPALERITKATKGNYDAFTKLTFAVGAQGSALGTAQQHYKQATEQQNHATAATKAHASAATKDAQQVTLAGQAQQQYAQMLGYVADKQGQVAASAGAGITKIAGLARTATSTGSELLDSLSQFASQVAQGFDTAAMRAQLMGATLKAANGDALSFAGSMATLAQAERQLVADLRSAQPVQDAVNKATNGMADGAAKTAAATAAADQAMKGYIGTIVNLRTGTINYSAQGAGPLITDLQSIQTAAMNAASATYQHEVATKGATRAADDAYNVYANQTRGSLINQATQLGLTAAQAGKLADQYFGLKNSGDIKKTIEAVGADALVTVLNKLGAQLAWLTGHPWNIPVYYTIHGSPTTAQGKPIPNAAGSGPGGVRDGWFTVGEQGGNPNSWELGHKSGSRVDIFSNSRSRAMTGMSRVPGFAGGTGGFHLGGVGYPDQSSYQSALNALVQTAAAMLAAANNSQASAQDIQSAAADLVGAAHTQKVSAQLQQTLAMQGGRVSALASQRDRVSAMLGSAPSAPTAYDRLGAAQSAYAQEQSTVTGAFGFDVTTAGQNSWGVSSAGGILASIKAVAANARTFSSVVKKLAQEGLARGLVMQLAAAGPQALGAAQALAAATPAQLADINSSFRDLNSTAIGTGTSIADDYFKSGVDAASAIVKGLQSKQTLLNNAIHSIAAGMVSELEAGLGIKQSPGAKPPAHNVTVNVHGAMDPNAVAIATARRLAMAAA